MNSTDYLNDMREIYENYNAQSSRAWELQQDFYRDFGERQVEVYTAITEERMDSLKQLPEIETPAQLFELGMKLDESARERLIKLYEDNSSAIQQHYSDLAEIYAPTQKPAAKKPAAQKRTTKAA